MAKTKLIFACDISDPQLGLDLITEVVSEVNLIKLGLEAMTAETVFGKTLATLFREQTLGYKKSVMWDMKILDVKNTMANAVRNIVFYGSTFFTLHAQASDTAHSLPWYKR